MTQLNIYLSFTDPLTIMGASGPSNTASMAGTKAGKPDEERKHCFQYESDDYAEFKGSHLMVPYVAARYRELFELLEVPFNLTPQKLLASCVAEFRKLRDEGQYETEREILIRYAESYQLKEMAQQIGQMKRKETKYYVGNVDQEGAVFVDTIKLGIRGIADLSKQMDAFCLNAQNHQASYENTCQQILAHLRSQEASALA